MSNASRSKTGMELALHGVFVNNALSDSCPIVSDEYNRLKSLMMETENMSGGISNAESN